MTTSSAEPAAAIRLPLRVRHCGHDTSVAAADAWLLLGADPADWISELANWGMALAHIRLLPLPSSSADRRAFGVLAIPESAKPVRVSSRALPYQCVAGRLYIPAEAKLHPPVADAELRQLCPWTAAVLHPSIGLVGFEAADVLRIADLIRASSPHTMSWSDAQPGIHSEPRVREVRPEVLLSVERLIQASRDDIGDAPLDELPPTPDEGAIKQLGRQARLGGLEALRKLLRTMKHPALAPTTSGAMENLSNWATRHADDLRAQIDASRQRELSRLLRLLEENPDEGLRYALPLNGLPSARGTAEGGSRLRRRETNFNLGNLFGSRPTSFWDTPWEARQRLLARYRELAQRELALGRHRRAAYIYSELLDDHHAAAGALAEGRYFREAATLYREKLKNPAAAAACLEGGGLLLEAAEAYESVGQFEKAGDLHASLQSGAGAARLYNAAVNAFAKSGDTLGAARVLEQKLRSPDLALARLNAAWDDNTSQSEQCLRESFRLLARRNKHDASELRLNELRASAAQATRPASLAKVLADTASDYPTREGQALARDATRVVAGYALANVGHTLEHASLLQILARTDVEDRLLHRDALRYRELQNRAAKVLPKEVKSASSRETRDRGRKKLQVIARWKLPGEEVSWRSVSPIGRGFLALGVSESEVVLARGDWMGRIQTARCRFADAANHDFRYAGVNGNVLVVPLNTSRRLPAVRIPPFHSFNELRIGHANILPPGDIHGIATDDGGNFDILYTANIAEVILNRVSAEGLCVRTVPMPLPAIELDEPRSLWLHTQGDHTLITAGRRLHWLTRGVVQPPIELPSAARGAVVSPRRTALRVVVATDDDGCVMIWPQLRESKNFARSIVGAVPALLPDGFVIAIGARTGAIFAVSDRTFSLVGDSALEPVAPVNVIISDAAPATWQRFTQTGPSFIWR